MSIISKKSQQKEWETNYSEADKSITSQLFASLISIPSLSDPRVRFIRELLDNLKKNNLLPLIPFILILLRSALTSEKEGDNSFATFRPHLSQTKREIAQNYEEQKEKSFDCMQNCQKRLKCKLFILILIKYLTPYVQLHNNFNAASSLFFLFFCVFYEKLLSVCVRLASCYKIKI